MMMYDVIIAGGGIAGMSATPDPRQVPRSVQLAIVAAAEGAEAAFAINSD